MRKQCKDCMFSKRITLSDRLNGYRVEGIIWINPSSIPKDDNHIICVLRRDVHRATKEQRKCSLYERKI